MVRELESDGMIQGLKNLDSQVMANISFTYVILVGGIVAASLSSAIASLVGAPKVFQAICKDHLFPYVGAIGKGSPKDDEPRRGYILTALIGMVKHLISIITQQKRY